MAISNKISQREIKNIKKMHARLIQDLEKVTVILQSRSYTHQNTEKQEKKPKLPDNKLV